MKSYTDLLVDDEFDSDLDIGSDISDKDLRGIVEQVNSINVPGIERELADATTQLQDRYWKAWQKF